MRKRKELKRGAEAYAAGRLSLKQLPPPSRGSQRTLPPWRQRDLPHQRQAEADAAFALGMAGQAEEGLEDALAVGLGHARAAVAHQQLGLARGIALHAAR